MRDGDERAAANVSGIDPDAVDPRIARTRRLVLSAALELIGEGGFGRVSMESVAERAGVARSTLYRNWRDLPSLLGDAVRVQALVAVTPDTGDLRGDLLAAMRMAAGFLEDRDLRSILLSMLAESFRDPKVGRLHQAHEQQRRERIRELLVRGQRRGELPADVELDVLIDDLIAPVFHRVMALGADLDEDFLVWHLERTLSRHGA